MDRRVVLVIATVTSFAGILGLYFYSCSIDAITIRIGDIGMGDVGTIVKIKGYVADHRVTSKGDLILTLADYGDSSTITVYIPENIYSSIDDKMGILPSASIEVVGEVQEYQGELEIVVNSSDGVKVLEHPNNSNLTIEILSRNPELFEGADVTVYGQIQNFATSFRWIQEEYKITTSFQLRYSGEYMNYTMDCLLTGFDVSKDFYQGQTVRFTGTFDYYEKEAKWRIVSDEMTLHS
jgi:DNA/RNA endonuclease YhcR with UshA esterase domain